MKLQGLSLIGADTRKNIADHHIKHTEGVVITMRIYAEANDQLLKDINLAVKKRGICKTQIVLEAPDRYLHGSDHGELAEAISELDKTKAEARIDLELTKRDHEHALDTIRQDREQIRMLSALTHQLTEKITTALPPSQEEARAKHWYQFWK